MRRFVLAGSVALSLLYANTAAVAPAASQPQARPAERSAPNARQLSTRDAEDLRAFERKAGLLRELGATQMNLTEGLPLAVWQTDPQDAYRSWYLHHADMLKLFPPAAMRPFVDMQFAGRVQRILADRCRVLARHGMTGVWHANEPAVLPEPFFLAYPHLRGPRIDHPNRSTKVHFAPNVDNPEMLAMYRETVTALLATCPQVETFQWVTTDAGSGFDWAPALYPGPNGNSNYADRPLADRVVGFMTNIKQAARTAGHDVRIVINQIEPRQWMIPTFGPDVLQNIVRQLPPGMAVNGKEGPDGRPFQSGVVRQNAGSFYPIVGLVVPTFAPVAAGNPERRGFDLGDPHSVDFNYRMIKATSSLPMGTASERLAALRAFAVSEVGESNADELLAAWQALDDVQQYLDVLSFGGTLRFGHVLNRWITRPMVPYPLELTAEEKAAWRPFLFQAKGEEQATNLIDVQAMRMYEGYGAHMLFQRAVELATPRAERALGLVQGIRDSSTDPSRRAYWDLTGKRIQALVYLLRSADGMVAYQAHLDRANALGIKPEANPVLGVQGDWSREEMINLARREMDTAINLQALLASTNEPILDLAPTSEEETIMRLGPDLPSALRRKVLTMSAHWRDYDRMFTLPNP